MRCSLVKAKLILLLAVALLCLLLLLKGCLEKDGEKTQEGPPVPTEPKKREVVTSCQEDPTAKTLQGFAQLPPFIQDFLSYKHCRSFSQILDEPMKCGGREKSNEVFLLLAIKTSPQNLENREVLRQTWAQESSYHGARVKRVFLSGISKDRQEDRRLRQLLKMESEKYGDILQWDFHDTFYNLTLKQFLFFRWFSENCPGAHFVMSMDNDIFVNTVNVIAYLRDKKPNSHLFVGHLIPKSGPIRSPESKYYIPVQVYSSDSYPPYVAGGGILMSRYTAHVIYNTSLEIPLIPIDDVYFGMCLEKAGLAPASHMAISTVGLPAPSENVDTFDPCFYRQILMVHRFLPFEMMIMWKAVQAPNLDCGPKHFVSSAPLDKAYKL